jgi:hypothetical protein
MDSPDLNYNLGVVYYQLARYEEAEERFQLLIDIPKYTAVAYYNLGLLALKREDNQAAKDNFSVAHSLAVDENLKALSERALQLLNADPPAKNSPFSGWGGFVSLNGGYDDNVSLIDEDISQVDGLADYSSELFISASGRLVGNNNNGLYFDANGDVLKQQKEHDYDYSQWHLGLGHLVRNDRWETRARAAIDQTEFGNVDFQKLLSLELRGRHYVNTKNSLELRYKYVDIKDKSPDGVYDYLAGNRQQLRLRLLNGHDAISFKFSYELQVNDRNDFSSQSTNLAGDTVITTRSYSPIRHSLEVSAGVPWGKSLTVNMEAEYRYSEYRDPDTETTISESDGSSSTSLYRKDHRYKLKLGFAYSITPFMELFTDYGYTKNVSNREGSGYNHNLIRLGVTWFY